MNTQILLNISADGSVILPVEPLRQAGFEPGDQLILSIVTPGHLYLHKADALPQGGEGKDILRRLMQQAFQQQGYYQRAQIVTLMREVRQEIANEQ